MPVWRDSESVLKRRQFFGRHIRQQVDITGVQVSQDPFQGAPIDTASITERKDLHKFSILRLQTHKIRVYAVIGKLYPILRNI